MTNAERTEMKSIIDENYRDYESFGKWYTEVGMALENAVGFATGLSFYARHSNDPEVIQLKKLIGELKGKLIDISLQFVCEEEDSPGVE